MYGSYKALKRFKYLRKLKNCRSFLKSKVLFRKGVNLFIGKDNERNNYRTINVTVAASVNHARSIESPRSQIDQSHR